VAPRWRSRFTTNSVRKNVEDVKELTARYVKEETVEPLKALGRYAAFGVAGSIFVGLGSLFALVGVLRLLQTETGAFHGNLSWIPYLIVVVLAAVEVALVGLAVMSGPARRRLTTKEDA
jgi:hypothetical protein